jgi:hypothetical protein
MSEGPYLFTRKNIDACCLPLISQNKQTKNFDDDLDFLIFFNKKN